MITIASDSERTLLTDLWEESVRATHHFLKEKDIAFYRPYVETTLPDPELQVYVAHGEDGQPAGFTAIQEDSMEMLFVSPSAQGKGYGSRLLDFAIREKGITRTSVNEQNSRACRFYLNRGFVIAGRTPADGFGKPYPILLLELEKAKTLETERLRLRAFRPSDLPAFFNLCKEPEIGSDAGWKPHTSIEESRLILEETFLNKKTVWAIERKADSLLIGAIGLVGDPKRENPTARMLGYWMGKPYWGNGYMSEAAECVVAHAASVPEASLLTATCYTDNTRSQRILRKLGFIEESIIHASAPTAHGTARDEYSFYLPVRPKDKVRT